MKDQLAKIRAEALAALEGVQDAAGLDGLGVEPVEVIRRQFHLRAVHDGEAHAGEETGVLKMMGKLSPEERPVMGQMANDVRAAGCPSPAPAWGRSGCGASPGCPGRNRRCRTNPGRGAPPRR